MIRFRKFFILTTLIIGCVSVSCVNIETGQTPEEARESSESKASSIRSEWATRFESAQPLERARLLAGFLDDISSRYIDYGYRVVDSWREAQEGKGGEIPANEMRRMVGKWTEKEKPVLRANEDNIEYGLQRFKDTGFFTQSSLDLMSQIVSQYYEIYNVVFLPGGTVDDYEDSLGQNQRQMESLLTDFKNELENY